MALDPAKVGTRYPPYTYEVAREKVHEYARAIGDTDPRYLADDATCVAPPTFAACFSLTQAMQVALADDELGAHPALVHGGQRFTFGGRPLRPGDVLRCTPRIADIAARGDNEFLTIEVDCRLVDSDELAVQARSTLVLLGSAPGAGRDRDEQEHA